MTIQPHTVTTNSESLSDPQRSLPEVLQGLMWVRICMDASKKKKKKEAQFKQLLVLCLFVPLDCSIIFVLTFVSVQLCVCVDWQLS